MMAAIHNKELAAHVGKRKRGYETFDNEEGRKLMKEWEVPYGSGNMS